MDAALRAGVIARDHRQCVRCGAGTETGRPFSVHHRRLRSQGGTDTYENLIFLCGSGSSPHCHHTVHSRRRDIGIPCGYIVHSTQDPATAELYIYGVGWRLLSPDGTYTLTEGVTPP